MHDSEKFQQETIKAITDLQETFRQTMSRQLALGAMVKAMLGRVPLEALPTCWRNTRQRSITKQRSSTRSTSSRSTGRSGQTQYKRAKSNCSKHGIKKPSAQADARKCRVGIEHAAAQVLRRGLSHWQLPRGLLFAIAQQGQRRAPFPP